MRLAKLFENLDDKDTFMRTDCIHCNEQYKSETGRYAFDPARTDTDSVIDMDEFHRLHGEARQAAMIVGRYGTPAYKSEYEDVMNRHQYYYVPGQYGSHWVKEPIRENLDDKDEFGYVKLIAAHIDRSKAKESFPGARNNDHVIYVFEDGAKVFIGPNTQSWTDPGRMPSYSFAKLRTSDGNVVPLYSILQDDENIKYSAALSRAHVNGWQDFTPELRAEWQQVMEAPIKEDLDDKDEFDNCELCSLHNEQRLDPTIADIADFHNAHSTADQEYGSGPGWHRVLARYGYRMGALGWETIK